MRLHAGHAERWRRLLPAGTVSVGLGLAVGGGGTYGFLAIVARALGAEREAPFAAFWALLVVAGPGFFIPLEQEVGRAVAARRARGEGSLPLLLRAASAGTVLLAILVALTLAYSRPLAQHVFGGAAGLEPAFVAGLGGYAVQFLARGLLAGSGQFASYAMLVGSEGVLRAVLCAGLAAIGARSPAPYAFAIVLGSFLALLPSVIGRRALFLGGPPASRHELSRALVLLLISSVLVEVLVSAGTVAVQLLASPAERSAASRYLSSRVIAFIPLFLFAAVPATLLPRLSRLAASNRGPEFRGALRRWLLFAAGVGIMSAMGATVLGPLAVRILFGSAFDLGHFDFALLGSTCALLMVAQVVGGALVALRCYGRLAVAWLCGIGAFAIITAAGTSLFIRVEAGILGGVTAAVVVMSILLSVLLPSTAAAADRVEVVSSSFGGEVR